MSAATSSATSAMSRRRPSATRPRTSWRPIDADAPVSGHQPPPTTTASAADAPEHDWALARDLVQPAFRPVGTQGLAMDSIQRDTLLVHASKSHAQPLIDEGPAGIPVVYTIPATGFDIVVNGDHLLSWGIEPSELQDAAMRNLAAWAATAPWTDESDGPRRLISSDTGDGLDAVRILLPETAAHLARELDGGARVLVGLPERHMLMASTLRADDAEWAGLFSTFVARAVGWRGRTGRPARVRARRRAPGRLRGMTEGLRSAVDGGVATLTLDRPAALNALTIALKVALLEALRAIERDRSVRAVILTGAGRAFCAGQDLAERDAPDAAPLDEELRDRYEPIVRAMVGLDRPIIAAINGVAAGAGASLALACDLRIAAESARFVLAFGRIGLVPDSGATWFLPRIVGSARAAELALLNMPLGADEALRAGLVSRVVPDDALLATAREMAEGLVAGAPLAIAATKRLLAAGLDDGPGGGPGRRARRPGPSRRQSRSRRGAGRLPREAAAAVHRGVAPSAPGPVRRSCPIALGGVGSAGYERTFVRLPTGEHREDGSDRGRDRTTTRHRGRGERPLPGARLCRDERP